MNAATNNIGYLLQHLATSLTRQTDQILMHELGLGFSQFKILVMLQEGDGAQQKEIAYHLGQTEASISRQVKGLKTSRLVNIKVNPDNRREHRISLTSRGRQLSEDARQVLNHHFAPLFASLNNEEQERFWNTLSKMHSLVCQPGQPGACDFLVQ